MNMDLLDLENVGKLFTIECQKVAKKLPKTSKFLPKFLDIFFI